MAFPPFVPPRQASSPDGWSLFENIPCESILEPDAKRQCTEWRRGGRSVRRGTAAAAAAPRFEVEECFEDHTGRMNLGFCRGRFGGTRAAIVKYVRRDENSDAERAVLTKLLRICGGGGGGQHPSDAACRHVVSLYGIVPHPNRADSVGIVMQYLNGGSLFVNRFSPTVQHNAVHYVDQILSGLRFLHRNGVIHCDVKLENVVLHHRGPETTAVIVDLGLATSPGAPIRGGTPGYFLREPNQPATEDQDLYALVVSMYTIFDPPVVDSLKGPDRMLRAAAIDLRMRTLYPAIRDADAYFARRHFRSTLGGYATGVTTAPATLGGVPRMPSPFRPPSAPQQYDWSAWGDAPCGILPTAAEQTSCEEYKRRRA